MGERQMEMENGNLLNGVCLSHYQCSLLSNWSKVDNARLRQAYKCTCKSLKIITSTNLCSSFTIRLQCKYAELLWTCRDLSRESFWAVTLLISVWASVPISSSVLLSSQAERGVVVAAPRLFRSPPLLPSSLLAVILPLSLGPCWHPTSRALWQPPLQRNAPDGQPPSSSEWVWKKRWEK